MGEECLICTDLHDLGLGFMVDNEKRHGLVLVELCICANMGWERGFGIGIHIILREKPSSQFFLFAWLRTSVHSTKA